MQATDNKNHTLLAYLMDANNKNLVTVLMSLLTRQQLFTTLRAMVTDQFDLEYVQQALEILKGENTSLSQLFYQLLRESGEKYHVKVLQLIVNNGFVMDCNDSRTQEIIELLLPMSTHRRSASAIHKVEFLLRNDVNPFSHFMEPIVFERLISAGMNDPEYNELIECLNPPFELITHNMLILTAKYTNPSALRVLLKNGADAGVRDGTGNTLLHIISHIVSEIIPTDSIKLYVDILIANRVNFRCKNISGDTPLHTAAACNNAEFINIVAKDIDLNCGNEIGDSPLLHAIRQPTYCGEVIESLINHGANKNANNNDGMSALHVAVQSHHDDFDLHVPHYIKHFDPNQLTQTTRDTPLMVACSVNNYRAVSFLLNIDDVDLYQQNYVGSCALHKAVFSNSLQALDVILKIKPFVNCTNDNLETPLHLAAGLGYHECCRKLLSGKANVNACNTHGDTPLLIAAYYGHEQVVRVLLESASINVNIVNMRGITALHRCRINGFQSMERLLIEKGAV
jgi:ankyrin repeat protein